MAAIVEYLSVAFDWVARTSLQAAVLVCLILAIQTVLRRKLSPRWHYTLWLILLVRLAVPWAPESSLSMFNLLPFGRQPLPASVLEPIVRPHAIPETPPAVVEVGTVPAATERQPYKPPSHVEPLPLLWLIGALIIAGYAVGQNVALSSRVSRHRPVTDQAILELLEECKKAMGVRSFLSVVETPRAKSPALLGTVRPRLLLPEGMIATLGRDELRFVFLHELAHVKRHDIALNWLMTMLQVLHWFNPLIWFAFYRMRADREVACDALVLSRTRPGESRDYGRTIVNLLERFSQPRRVPGLAGILEDKSQLKRRIAMIALFKRGSYRWSALAVIVLALLGCLALTDAKRDAQGEAYSPARAEMEKQLDEIQVSLDFRQTPIDDILEFLGDTYAVNLVLDERVMLYPDVEPDSVATGPGSIIPTVPHEIDEILVQDVPLRDALDALTKQVGLEFMVTDYVVWISRTDVLESEKERIRRMPVSGLPPSAPIERKLNTKVDVHFGPTNLHDILEFLQSTVGINIVLDERVVLHPGEPPVVAPDSPGAITPTIDLQLHFLMLQEIPLRHALKAILSKRGLDYTVTEHFVWVSRPDVLENENGKFDELLQPLPPTSEEMQEKLLRKVDLNFGRTNIRDILQFLQSTVGVNIVLDERVMIDAKRRVERKEAGGIVPTIHPEIQGFLVQDIPLRHALKALLCPIGLDYGIEEHFVWVTRPDILGTDTYRESVAAAVQIRGRVLSEQTRRPLRHFYTWCFKDEQRIAEPISTGENEFRYVLAKPGTYDIQYRPQLSPDPEPAFHHEVRLNKGNVKDIVLTLPEPFTMSVRVVDSDGRPIPEMGIGPCIRRHDGRWFKEKGYKTDQYGRFVFSEFAPGVESGFHTYVDDGYTTAESAKIVGEPGTVYPEETIVLYKLSGSVTGTVVGQDGKPIRRRTLYIEVRFDDGLYALLQTRTDSDGVFTKEVGLPGRKATLTLRRSSRTKGGDQWTSEPIEIVLGETVDLGKIVLAPPGEGIKKPVVETELKEEDRISSLVLDSIQKTPYGLMAIIRRKGGRKSFVRVGQTFESDFKLTNIDLDNRTVDVVDSQTNKTYRLSISDSKAPSDMTEDVDAVPREPRLLSPARTEMEKKLDAKVDLNFGRTDIRNILEFLETSERINIVVDQRVIIYPDEPPTVTPTGPDSIVPTVNLEIYDILVQDIPLRHALKALLSKLGLDYAVTEHFVWVSRPDVLEREKGKFDELLQPLSRASEEMQEKLLKKVDINFGRTDFHDILNFLETSEGVNIVVDDRVVIDPERARSTTAAGPIVPTVNPTIHGILVQDIPLRHALKALLCSIGLDYNVEEHFIWVSRPDVLIRQSSVPEPAEKGVHVGAVDQQRASGSVIGHLKSRDKVITIMSGPGSPLYTVKDKDGTILAEAISENELYAKFPNIGVVMEYGFAANGDKPGAWSDARVGIEPLQFAR